MKIITLYKHIRPDGGVTISTIQPDCDYVQMTEYIDDATSDGWTEVDMPNELIEEYYTHIKIYQ